ncbi:BZ3500_MvSof-1268-A1-R1_Chr4-1g06742 [Microbotryum saponariae]|uniref:BZ3500_MvSof-1268-A1-R1_Chr4-1g06742 protein n=1 Tax=Microbotryum saponariae TaxID=289078 RepID=A0A2X0NL97_9BASI|nr:BZ3500_MvSof-1268-A1-R1_Chr4-1g06742 [Microbotryum saponariae]SDA06407.1 BZ3501_MvSof-1269-A2-R1_Chr4-1g06452 [Microbotryum saponariae]
MVKNEAGSVNRAIDKRSKMKGLQKLRYYCQVCEKQCRDENGFKCHTQSESHLRQMLVVGESAGKHITDYTQNFQNDFVTLLSRRFSRRTPTCSQVFLEWGTKRVRINQVYQEFISDKNHLHMNATRFTSLTEFAKHLGREGIAHVDENEKGWWVSWIDTSPRALARQEASMKKEKGTIDDEMRMRKLIQQQIERARAEGEKRRSAAVEAGEAGVERVEEAGQEELTRELKRDEGEKVQLKMEFKMATPAVASSTAPSTSATTPPTPIDETSASPLTTTNDVESTPAGAAAASAPTPPLKSSFIAPPPKAVIGFTPKPNAFKLAAGKPNPLKANAFKTSNPLKATSSSSASGGGNGLKRPPAQMSAVEQIVAEEMARKQRRMG